MAFWQKKPLLKNYVSKADQFLQAFDRKPQSTSKTRRTEEAKYKEIHHLRDNSEEGSFS